jgi:hypothetical protein
VLRIAAGIADDVQVGLWQAVWSPSCSASATRSGSPNQRPETSPPCWPSPTPSLAGDKANDLHKQLACFETNAYWIRHARLCALCVFVRYGTVESGCKALPAVTSGAARGLLSWKIPQTSVVQENRTVLFVCGNSDLGAVSPQRVMSSLRYAGSGG